MSFRETHLVYGIRCDKGGCDALLTGADMPTCEGHRYFERLAIQEGWSIWFGRSRRAYCPLHGPSRGTAMQRDDRP